MIGYFKLQTELNQRITFKQLFSNVNVKSTEERNFRKNVKNIYLKSILNQQTSGIRKFENDNYIYKEILLLEITLLDTKNIRLIERILQEAFPNPVILITKYRDKVRVSTAIKRLNKQGQNKTVIEKEAYTRLIEPNKNEAYLNHLIIIKDKSKNLFEYYNLLYYWCSYENARDYVQEVKEIKPNDIIIKILKEIEQNNVEINILEEEKRKGRQVSDRMKAHKELNRINNIKRENIKKLMEGLE